MRILTDLILSATAACSLLSPLALLASDSMTIEARYKEFNSKLLELNLAEPISLIEKGSHRKGSRMLAAVNTDSVRGFYAEAFLRSNDECLSSSNCRLAHLMFLNWLTLQEYRVNSFDLLTANDARLVVLGKRPDGIERKVVSVWLLESGEWKLSLVSSGPPN